MSGQLSGIAHRPETIYLCCTHKAGVHPIGCRLSPRPPQNVKKLQLVTLFRNKLAYCPSFYTVINVKTYQFKTQCNGNTAYITQL